MTAQVHDRVRWRGGDYLLVGVDGEVLFDPLEHGLNPAPTTTANWRGWVAVYAISDDRLLLADLTDVGWPREPGASPPTLRGVQAISDSERGPFRYEGLDWPLEFSGRMIVARGFIQSLYRHMGFHPAWKFEESWEFDFDKGRLTDSRDMSDEMARFRKKIKRNPRLDPDHEARPGWLERTFTLAFRRSKGR